MRRDTLLRPDCVAWRGVALLFLKNFARLIYGREYFAGLLPTYTDDEKMLETLTDAQ